MSSPVAYTELGPLPSPPLPLVSRIQYHIQLLLMKYGAKFAFIVLHLFSPPPKALLPTLTKTYPANPHLVHRIFYPPTYRPGFSVLPLYLDIHGGGFALLDPSYDDEHNALLAKNSNCIVISLDYSKAPSAQFPVPVRELVSTVTSILSDISLSFDHSRVCIGGFSAGGNLALSVSQHASLRRKIHGLVAYYPVVDFSTKSAEKTKTRPYAKASDVDPLYGSARLFNYGYVPADQDLRDPLLSPTFIASRDYLPEWLCFVGAEMDMLCHEAGLLAGKLGGIDVEGKWATGGQEKDGWEVDGGKTKWMFVKGANHGFTHFMMERGEQEEMRKRLAEKTAFEVGQWLAKGPYAGAGKP